MGPTTACPFLPPDIQRALPARLRSCRFLAAPFVAEDLPGHVCQQTLKDSVRSWLLDQYLTFAPILDEVVGHVPPPERADLSAWMTRLGIAPDERAANSFARVFERAMAQHEPQLRELERHDRELGWRRGMRDIVAATTDLWPFPFGFRHLGLVIREWVEGPPNRTLANLLAQDEAWQTLRRDVAVWYAEEKAAQLSITPESWVGQHRHALPETDRDLASILRRCRLPSTPAVVRHLYATAVGVPDPLPAYGLLVTTRAFVQVEGDATYLDPTPDITIGGDLEFVTSELLNQARAVALKHRDWLRDVRGARHWFTDPHQVHRAATGSFAQANAEPTEDYYDYLAEAVADAHLDALRKYQGREPERKLSQHIASTQRRVYKRRKGKGMDTTPPGGWGEEARRLIRAKLRDTTDH